MYFRGGECITDLEQLKLSRLHSSYIGKALKLKAAEFRQSSAPMWSSRL